jgi:ketosteroid isomerase-like protein
MRIPKYRLACIAMTIFGAVQTAQAQYTDYVPHTDDEIALVRAEDQWCDAAIKRDKTRLEEVFADDLIYLTAKGSMNKAQTITDYLTGTQILSLRLTEVLIRVFGDSAVVTSHVHVRYKNGGKTVRETHASTDVFIKRDGVWRLVST